MDVMLSLFQAGVFGALQGVSELFPISSLGHSVVLPKLLGWNVNQSDPFFLTFLVATHTATATVLFLFFFKDWINILKGLGRSLKRREIRDDDPDAKLGWLLIIGTVPAGILGILFQDALKNLFANPRLVAFMLILNGAMLFGAEILRKYAREKTEKGSDNRLAKLTFGKALQVGTMQALALIPGLSRTGSAITGSLLVGLSHEDAARFAFLLATPVIGAAAVLKLPELAGASNTSILIPTSIGALFAALGAFLSVKFLTKYFQTKTLTPFAVYCVVIGATLSVLFLFR